MPMTKFEAIEAMKDGEKVTHRFFENHEFVCIVKGDEEEYLFDDGARCSAKEFWKYRYSMEWLSDWEIKI